MNLLSPLATVAAAAALFAFLAGVWWFRVRRGRGPPPLPREWSLAPRPVFSADERRVHRSLREALPHHVVLAKLPLVRFCQPVNPDEIAYWYELLGSIHVTFAICSANGRVLAAIDLDTERGSSRRVSQIKQAVLGACRVRYLRCPVDHLPSVAELQLLVPQNGQPVRAPLPMNLPPAGTATQARRSAPRARRELWQDSTLFQDSFAPDARSDSSPSGEGLPRPGTRAESLAAAVAARFNPAAAAASSRSPSRSSSGESPVPVEPR